MAGKHREDAVPLEPEYAGVDNPAQLRQLTARIVGGYLSHHTVPAGQLANLIAWVYDALRDLHALAPPTEIRTPAVPVRQSVGRDYVVCLECGFRGQTLGRHLTLKHQLTPAQYRTRWNLPGHHPVVAPLYTERRSAIARQIGLGRRRAQSPRPETPAKSVPSPKLRRRRRSSPDT